MSKRTAAYTEIICVELNKMYFRDYMTKYLWRAVIIYDIILFKTKDIKRNGDIK